MSLTTAFKLKHPRLNVHEKKKSDKNAEVMVTIGNSLLWEIKRVRSGETVETSQTP